MPTRGKDYNVDGKQYTVFIKKLDFEDDAYNVRISIRAKYGSKSCVTINDLRNINKWDDRGENAPNTERHIQITPRAISVLTRRLLAQGWDPVESKSNLSLSMSNGEFLEITKRKDGTASEQ